MNTFRSVLAAGILGVAWTQAGPVYTQTPDVMRGMDTLKRVAKPDPDMKPVESPGAEIQDARSSPWRKLKTGMTEKEVTALLGKPDRTESHPQSFRWYWDKTQPRGWVGFGSESRKVVEWRNL